MMPDLSFATNSAMVSNVFGASPVMLYKFLTRIKVISANAVLMCGVRRSQQYVVAS